MSKFKKYLEYLYEMSYSEALKVFGIDSVEDKDELKKKYRVLSMKNHPDTGGSLEAMKDITVAYDILAKKSGGMNFPSGRKSREQWKAEGEERDKKYRMAGVQIKTALLSNFQPDIFINYLQEMSGLKFQYEIIRVLPLEKDRSPSSAGFDVEFFTKDRNSIFTFKVHANLIDIVWPKAELGYGGDISYTVYTEAHGFHMNKKQKMSRSDWKHTRDHSFFRKPEMMFPKKKMKDIFSGKTSKRAFKKRDMVTYITKKLKGDWDGDFARIPLGDEYKLTVYRTTFMRQGTWGVNGVYLKYGRVSRGGGYYSFMEDEETAKIFGKIQQEVMKVKGEAKVKKTEQLLKQAYEAYKKSKGI